MARYHTVLFDLDGTVLDTIGMITASLRHTLATHLDWHPPPAVLTRGVGMPLAEQLLGHAQDAHARHGPPPDEALVHLLMATYKAHNARIHDAEVRAFPGAAALLTDLARRGTRLGIVTSKPHGLARHGLELCGLDQHFEVLIGSDDVQRHKPDPAPVHAALAALGTPVEGALFVGDSPYDLQSGRRAGVHTGAALWGPFPLDLLREDDPTHELTTLPQVAQVRP